MRKVIAEILLDKDGLEFCANKRRSLNGRFLMSLWRQSTSHRFYWLLNFASKFRAPRSKQQNCNNSEIQFGHSIQFQTSSFSLLKNLLLVLRQNPLNGFNCVSCRQWRLPHYGRSKIIFVEKLPLPRIRQIKSLTHSVLHKQFLLWKFTLVISNVFKIS